MGNPRDNKFLILCEGIVRTSITDSVISKLDKYFEQSELHAKVTSILRTQEKQLEIIQSYLIRYKLDGEYQDTMTCHVEDYHTNDKNEKIYAWQLAWSKLLNIGIIINPPVKAVVLLDYIKQGVNKKGEFIPESNHFSGKAFDIGGGSDISEELYVVSDAMKKDKLLGIKNYVVERQNNCLHINCV